MSYESELLEHLGNEGDIFDIRVMSRRCYFYDFDGYPARLWHGVGTLIDEQGNRWLGTIDASGTDHHKTPPLSDPRSGNAPKLNFSLPYIDKATYDALKADQSLAEGRELVIYNVIVKDGEGLRPGTPLRFSQRLIMRGTSFSEGAEFEGGSLVKRYGATVLARSIEYGKSIDLGGTYTDTSQVQRAEYLGVASDSGCSFVAGNSERTYVID